MLLKKNSFVNLVLLLSLYLPFEDFILRWFPVSDETYMALRQMPDVMVFSLLIFVLLVALAETKFPFYAVGKHSFLVLLVFIAVSLVTTLLIRSSLFNVVLNIKALMRYIFLLYILYFCRPTKRQVLIFIRLVTVLAFIQGGIGFAEALGGPAVRTMFQPREVASYTGMTFTAITTTKDSFGTMAATIHYAFFLLIGLVFFLYLGRQTNRGPIIRYTGILYLLAAIFFSGSRAAFFAAILAIIYYYYTKHGLRKITSLVMPASALLFFSIVYYFIEKGIDYDDFWFFLSPDFYVVLETQRLGLIRVFTSFMGDVHFLFGLSPDWNFLQDYILRHYKLPHLFNEMILKAIEDVYWTALFFYYGLFGVTLLIAFLVSVYGKLRQIADNAVNDFQYNLALSCKLLLLLSFILNFINQALEVRQFSFYLWTAIGLTVSLAAQSNNPQKVRSLENTPDT